MRPEEAFRVRQHGGPHPLRVSGASRLGRSEPSASDASLSDAASPPRGLAPPPESIAERRRVIAHFDVDCFYCQVEELRDPRLASIPMAVTQKYLIVTANYPARAHGLGKLMSIAEAKRLCPSVELVRGEDLTPYRLHAKRVRAALERFGPCEKLGLDECWVDLTAEVDRRVEAGDDPRAFVGRVFSAASDAVAAGINPRRPADVRRVEPPEQNPNAKPNDDRRIRTTASPSSTGGGRRRDEDSVSLADDLRRLRVGSAVAAEARDAVLRDANLRCSAGIAHNKFLAKLASGLHKPDDQTSVPRSEAEAAVAPLSTRALAGVGRKTARALADSGFETAADLRGIARGDLERRLGARVGARTHDAAWGVCRERVEAKGPPQAVTCEDSFVASSEENDWGVVERVVRKLAPDLIARIDEERDDALTENAFGLIHTRAPETLRVQWRLAGRERATGSASAGMPEGAMFDGGYKYGCANGGRERREREENRRAREKDLVEGAMEVLRANLPPRFRLTKLNLGATGFTEVIAASRFSLEGPWSGYDFSSSERRIRLFRQLASAEMMGDKELAHEIRRDLTIVSKSMTRKKEEQARGVAKREWRDAREGGIEAGSVSRGRFLDDADDGATIPGGSRRRGEGAGAGAGGCSDEEEGSSDEDGARFFADLADLARRPRRATGT